jgi:hypothetical protein
VLFDGPTIGNPGKNGHPIDCFSKPPINFFLTEKALNLPLSHPLFAHNSILAFPFLCP